MKKIFVITTMSLVAIGAFAQGQINFNTQVGSGTTAIKVRVHAPDTNNPLVQQTGNASNDAPTGNTVYTGVSIGGTNVSNTASGYYGNSTNFTAQIWALAGSGHLSSELVLQPQYTTSFRTASAAGIPYTAGAGFVITPGGADPGIANTSANGNNASVQMRVFDNMGGNVTSWNQAVTTSDHGASGVINVTGLWNGDTSNPTPPANNLTGLQSFSLVSAVPEPSTIALGVMGAAAFLLRRRNK